jgi:hypothetical protein
MSTPASPADHLHRAIILAGGRERLGTAIDCTGNAIYQAILRGSVSAEMAHKIHEWSGGRVSRHDLCPAVYGARPKGRAAKAKAKRPAKRRAVPLQAAE